MARSTTKKVAPKKRTKKSSELLVVADAGGSPTLYQLENRSKLVQAVNLDTFNADGRRESLFIPTYESVKVTKAQLDSKEVQKLLSLGILVRR